MDRRDFFKLSLAGGAALAAGSSPAEARETHTISPDALGLLYDATLCIGCKACVSACKEANEMPPEFLPKTEHIGVILKHCLDIRGEFSSFGCVITPNDWLWVLG